MEELKEKIPKELQHLNNWCVHSKKIPYNTNVYNNSIYRAKSNDNKTWGAFDRALELVGNTYGNVSVDGTMLAITKPYIAIDLDHVINSDGVILPEALEIIHSINSYTEVSQSGRGIHIYTKTDKPLNKDGVKGAVIPNNTGWKQTDTKPPEIEIYQANRFMCVTGDVYSGYKTINKSSDNIHKLYNKYFSDSSKQVNNTQFTPYSELDEEVEKKADDIISKILKGKNNKLIEVFNGNYADYFNSGSEGDLYLCCMCAKYTKDTRVIDCIYKKSQMYTERQKKWDRLDYKKNTINKAITNSKYSTTDKGRIKATKDNVMVVLKELDYNIKYDVLKNEIKVVNKADDKDIGYYTTEIYSYCQSIGFRINKADLRDYILYIALDNKYNPFNDYLINCENGIYGQAESEIDRLINTLTYDIPIDELDVYKRIESFYNELIKKWLVSVVALNYREDFNRTESKAIEGTLVLKGEQGIGKTTWLKNLLPNGFFKEGAVLRDSKDNKMEVYKYVMVELGELETTTRKETTGFLKNELTRTTIEYRPPYASNLIKFARHTTFCGSVNEEYFLKDGTGNRRFWILPIKDIDINTKIDINKLWNEVIGLYKTGYKWYLSSDERKLINTLNEDYADLDPVGLALKKVLDFTKDKSMWIYATAETIADIISYVLKKDIYKNNIASQLKGLKCEKVTTRVKPNNMVLRLWHIPPINKKAIKTSIYFDFSRFTIYEKIDGKYYTKTLDTNSMFDSVKN